MWHADPEYTKGYFGELGMKYEGQTDQGRKAGMQPGGRSLYHLAKLRGPEGALRISLRVKCKIGTRAVVTTSSTRKEES